MASIRKRTWMTEKNEPRSAWIVDFAHAAGKRGRRQFERKRDADAFRVEVEGQVRSGTFRADARTVTVSDAAMLYGEHLKGREQRGEQMTRAHREVVDGLITNHVLHPKRGVASVKLAQLTKGG